jgi:hypothetical protein
MNKPHTPCAEDLINLDQQKASICVMAEHGPCSTLTLKVFLALEKGGESDGCKRNEDCNANDRSGS